MQTQFNTLHKKIIREEEDVQFLFHIRCKMEVLHTCKKYCKLFFIYVSNNFFISLKKPNELKQLHLVHEVRTSGII